MENHPPHSNLRLCARIHMHGWPRRRVQLRILFTRSSEYLLLRWDKLRLVPCVISAYSQFYLLNCRLFVFVSPLRVSRYPSSSLYRINRNCRGNFLKETAKAGGDSSGNWTPATTLETRKTAGVRWSTVITGRLTDDHQSFGGLNERRPTGNGFTFNFLCQE